NKSYLLLLDINMPKMDGVEVLRRIKADEELKEIPVVMLTTTDDPREVEACYKIGCNIYITKPVDFFKFAETLKRLSLFIQIVKI
ncbi:MAG: response regulator, partial [Bacteroidales bacterium]